MLGILNFLDGGLYNSLQQVSNRTLRVFESNLHKLEYISAICVIIHLLLYVHILGSY